MGRLRLTPEQYRRVTVVAAVLVALIIVTGALVRLTGSGLGCPDWPTCAKGQLQPPSDADFHSWVEFVNRMVTGLVSLAVIIAVLGALVRVPRRRDLTWLAVGLVVGVIAQALLGALVVKKLLSPPFVMGHFLLSAVLLADALVLVWRAGVPDGVRTPVRVPARVHRTAIAMVVLASCVLVTGTVVTGTGPHSGDAGKTAEKALRATRIDLPITTAARIHSVTVWIFLASVLLLLWFMNRTGATKAFTRKVTVLLVLLVAQGAIGYLQYFTQIPVELVAIHVAGATAVFSAAVWVLLACREPVAGSETAPEVAIARPAGATA